MSYKRIIVAVMSMLMLTACGENTESEISSEPIVTESTTEKVETTITTETTETTRKSTTVESTEKATTSTTAEKTTTVKKTIENNKTTTAEKVSVTTKTAETTEKVTEVTTEAVTEEASKYDAEFNLAETPYVEITKGGDYIVRGYTADGQIYINTQSEEKVELTLDGVDISCQSSSAILVNQAKRCIIKLAEGSTNYLRDGGNDKVNDGVIFSNDTLRLKGKGSLEINSGNAHGIASDDDVIIESGTYIINAVKTGITAHDDITINGGDLQISGGTNGIKSKGTVNINGGNMYISGGEKEEKSSIYASVSFSYTGGKVFAYGNQVTPPAFTPNPYIVVNYADGISAGNTIGLVLNGAENAVLYPQKNLKCILMLAPEICVNDTFTAYLNGTASSDFTVSEGQNIFTIE
ncbi:MAG: carbohydrate-binding domain-containing protein [Ruminococcus sp.]|nr:carbohydrate-binding domain-containing protein [Ruminococcus sp.]